MTDRWHVVTRTKSEELMIVVDQVKGIFGKKFFGSSVNFPQRQLLLLPPPTHVNINTI